MTVPVKSLKDLSPFLGQCVAISPSIYYANGREYNVYNSKMIYGYIGERFFNFDNLPPGIFFSAFIEPGAECRPWVFNNETLRQAPLTIRKMSLEEMERIADAFKAHKASLQVIPYIRKQDEATRIWA